MSIFRRFRRKVLIAGMVLILATIVPISQVFALDLKTAKQQCLVGETTSGYLEAIKKDSAVKKLVKEINAKRKAKYQEIAQKRKIPIKDVEQLAGKKAIEKTPKGHCIKVGNKWVKK